jgi:ATP-binding cassette subfamily B protein
MSIGTDASLAWILGVTLPVLFLVIGILIYYGMPIFRSIQAKTDHLNLIAREGLTGVRVIRAFDREPTQQARFAEANDDLTDTTIKVNRMMVTMMPIMQLLMQFTTIAIIWFGSHLINDMSMQLGDMMAFLQYAMQILFSVLMLSMIFVMYPRVSVSAERINEVLETEPEIEDPLDPVEASSDAPSVRFADVKYSFPGSEQPATCGIDFSAKKGTVTAIIGSTGSGKSTLLNLIERLYDVSDGAVLVNDVDVRDMTQHDLHELIGYIPQKAVLFDGTIGENIRFGREDATDEEVWRALEIAQARDFVEALDDGLDSRVSQGGTNFSGGQKQRLAIARAVVKNPEIYLFDDALSALDLKTDAALREAIAPEFAKSVAIIVAQRISSIVDADQILVMDEGCIVGRGTHEELLRDNQVYREIALSQMTEEELIEGGLIAEEVMSHG